jgi:hypothetical protein
MKPTRPRDRLIGGHEAADGNVTDNHNRQIRRHVISAVVGIVLAADGAVVDGLEERPKELAFAALLTSAQKPALDALPMSRLCLDKHCSCLNPLFGQQPPSGIVPDEAFGSITPPERLG